MTHDPSKSPGERLYEAVSRRLPLYVAWPSIGASARAEYETAAVTFLSNLSDAPQGWRPIETHDGSSAPVDLWAAERERYVSSRLTDCRWRNGRWVHQCTVYDDEDMVDDLDDVEVFNVTHWQPLPAPPPKDPTQLQGEEKT